MMNFIPNVINPLPDELLYSWVLRLAKANGLPPIVFFGMYFGQKSFSTNSYIPVDIRRGFIDFYESLNIDIPASELYLNLSTTQFELLAYPPKLQIKVINNVFRKESGLNYTQNYFISDFNMCPECMKEDVETFGEVYIHRSHQLTGVKVCHKHHTPLLKQHTNRQSIYNFDKKYMDKIQLVGTFEEECNYADYTYQLLAGNIQSNSKDLINIILEELDINKKTNKDAILEINKILGENKIRDKWHKEKNSIAIENLIKLFVCLDLSPQDIINKSKGYNLIAIKHCKDCGRDFYTTNQAIEDGWGCVYCDDKLGEEELLKRLVKTIGNNEYIFRGLTTGPNGRLTLYHKPCGRELSTKAIYFLFKNGKCQCTQKLQRKEAEKRMKEYPDFKLIAFGGSSKPAKIHHNVCGKDFEMHFFRDFLETPKCRCCEIQQDITPELFRERVREIVGDEYEVLGDVYRLDDKVEIKHKKCGTIHKYKALHFLTGSRCPECYVKMSIKKTNIMLDDCSNGRYKVIDHNKYFLIIWDNKEEKEIQMTGKHIAQELLRPTPSTILEINQTKKKKEQISTWESWYRLCIEYKKEFGHLCPQQDEKYQGYAFGCWCSEQRMEYNKGVMSKDYIQKLEEIDFVFDAVFYKWNKRFEEYKEYVAETGDMNPKIDIIYNGNKVGNWCLGQRKAKNKGKLNPMFEELLLEFNPSFFDKRTNRNV